MEDKLLSGIFKLRASSISFLDADGFITWGDDELLFSADTSDWEDYETHFGRVSLLSALNSLVGEEGPGAITWSGTTTTATPTEIFLGGVLNERYTLSTSSTTYFNLACIARNNTNNDSKVWDIKGVAAVDYEGNAAIVGTPSYTIIATTAGGSDWGIAVSVNDGDNSFRLTVTGSSGDTVQWVVSN